MPRNLQIGVMGPGDTASTYERNEAYELGALIAEQGWTLISGGRKNGVMGAVNEGYKSKGGPCSIGISPTIDDDLMSESVLHVISTQMGSGRNVINALSSDIMIAIGNLSSAGTLTEVAHKLNCIKTINTPPVILLGTGSILKALMENYPGKVVIALSAPDVMRIIGNLLLSSKDNKHKSHL